MPIKGKILNKGFAKGQILEYKQIGKALGKKSFLSVFEIKKLYQSLSHQGSLRLEEAICKADSDVAKQLLTTYQLIINSETFESKVEKYIINGYPLRDCICQAVEDLVNELSNSSNEYLAQSSEDIKGVAHYLLEDSMDLGVEDGTYLLVASTLTPKEVLEIPEHLVKGIILREDKVSAHTRLLLRDKQIPCLYDCDFPRGLDDQEAILSGDHIFLSECEWNQNRITNDLDEADDTWFYEIKDQILISSVVHSPKEIFYFQENEILDIGLYRSEWIYLTSNSIPTYETQQKVFGELLSHLPMGRCRMRAVDLGLDKIPDYMDPTIFIKHHKRGSGLYPYYPEILIPQLKAIVSLSFKDPIEFLLPWVENVEEITFVKSQLKLLLKDKNDQIKLGMMIESQQGFANRFQLLNEVDFCVVGSTDFFSQILHKNREDLTEDDFQSKFVHYYLLEIVNAAKSMGKPIGICGGLLDTKAGIEAAIGLGFEEISLSAHQISGKKGRKNEAI